MKNVQVIDGSKNSTFEIYEVSNKLFTRIFPNGADVAFLEDVEHVLRKHEWALFYRKKTNKKVIHGIHGTLHLTGSSCSKEFFPTHKESEVLQQ
jgi:hypothetical protein